ncbi:MAG: outer membrane beta-barrel protein [Bacteroidales bacterium]|jgi:hypothetical protein
MKRIILTSLLILIFGVTFSQDRLHMVGVRAAYNISGVDFTPPMEQMTIKTYKNYSLLYTYYHPLWKTMPYFGIQSGVSIQEQGYIKDNKELRMTAVEIPFVSQFHVDFWKMRVLLNAGGFAGYRVSKKVTDVTNGSLVTDKFDNFDQRGDFGFIGGGGLAFILKPFEIQIECNYQYSLSNLYHPKKYSEMDLQFTYPHQLLISAALFIHL